MYNVYELYIKTCKKTEFDIRCVCPVQTRLNAMFLQPAFDFTLNILPINVQLFFNSIIRLNLDEVGLSNSSILSNLEVLYYIHKLTYIIWCHVEGISRLSCIDSVSCMQFVFEYYKMEI